MMIPVNLIRQYIFCPRIVFYNLLTDIKPQFPRHVSFGTEYHTLQDELLKNRRFKKLNINYREIVTGKYFSMQDPGIGGIVDLGFVCEDEVVPVEYKFIDGKPSLSHKLQLAAYGKLMSEYYGLPARRGIIIYSNNIKFYQVVFSREIWNKLQKVIAGIQKIVDTEIFPDSSATEKQCSQCEYLNYCNDRI